MSLQSVSPQEAKKLIDAGALLVDIREPDEYAREHIPQAHLRPISSLQSTALQIGNATQVIFCCRSGGRTSIHAERLAAAAPCQALMLAGGLAAWKEAGLPVSIDHRQPIDLMRQVQIAAGTAVVLGVLLGVLLTPWFYLLSGFVGAGLIFAGVTGFCGLARLLQVMPWNRRMAS